MDGEAMADRPGYKQCDLPGWESVWVQFRTTGYPFRLRREWAEPREKIEEPEEGLVALFDLVDSLQAERDALAAHAATLHRELADAVEWLDGLAGMLRTGERLRPDARLIVDACVKDCRAALAWQKRKP